MVIKDIDKQNKLTAGLDWVQFQIDMKIKNIINDVLGLKPELFIEKTGNLRYYDYENIGFMEKSNSTLVKHLIHPAWFNFLVQVGHFTKIII